MKLQAYRGTVWAMSNLIEIGMRVGRQKSQMYKVYR